MMIAAFLAPLQIFLGDLHGLNTFEHQPQKVAAMEGAWETKNGAPLILFGIPDEETKSNKYEIAIPKLASLILTHDLNGEVKGINDFGADRPRVAPVFYGFRIMVLIGMLMLALAWYTAYKLGCYANRAKQRAVFSGSVPDNICRFANRLYLYLESNGKKSHSGRRIRPERIRTRKECT